MSFTGFPHAAVDFYLALEQGNSREFWAAHRAEHERHVRAPMTALLVELEGSFGPGKVFRPHRDVRFSADKSPYKTHQGGYVATAESTGWYAEVSADGFRLGAGCYRMDPGRLRAYRAAVADERRGQELVRIVEGLEGAGWEIGGEQLRTAPRGVPRDHPRLRLLRHKALTAMRWEVDGDVVTTSLLLDEVRRRWEELRPFVDWLTATDLATPDRPSR
ncbi:DUF2461 domain-containing protein [Ornithinimicrobium sufpigmenti]|uniref:DUF2461 domain-containing protein n=1 Tax=Ornithinimicrobium sufpigmenti TaxID=2508882 RepID=UPI001035CA52|nr:MULTISPECIES: DUF2461 domain-containing protein [unclassified Ornithinimicrobium]